MLKNGKYLFAVILALFFLIPTGTFQALAGPSKNQANETKDLFNQEMRTLRAENMFLPMSIPAVPILFSARPSFAVFQLHAHSDRCPRSNTPF